MTRNETHEAEIRRLAKGWHLGWITIQRIVRRAECLPVLEFVKDKTDAN